MPQGATGDGQWGTSHSGEAVGTGLREADGDGRAGGAGRPGPPPPPPPAKNKNPPPGGRAPPPPRRGPRPNSPLRSAGRRRARGSSSYPPRTRAGSRGTGGPRCTCSCGTGKRFGFPWCSPPSSVVVVLLPTGASGSGGSGTSTPVGRRNTPSSSSRLHRQGKGPWACRGTPCTWGRKGAGASTPTATGEPSQTALNVPGFSFPGSRWWYTSAMDDVASGDPISSRSVRSYVRAISATAAASASRFAAISSS